MENLDKTEKYKELETIWDEIKEPERRFCPHPLWAWNDRLEETLCREEIDEMAKAGAGGFFMHARTGLSTEYLSKEWIEVTESCIRYASEKGLIPWGYDEDGWPSGFAGGKVQAENPETMITWLECLPGETVSEQEHILLRFRLEEDGTYQIVQEGFSEDFAIVVRSNSGYVDLLNPVTTKTFIQQTHGKYKESLSGEAWGKLGGFFTDEPQFKRENIPWSIILEEEFEAAFGYSLREKLPALFFDVKDAQEVRYDFYSLVSRLFVENYTGQLFNWCRENGLGFTGHFLNEDSLFSQMHGSAGVMPHYEYMSIPGMDWLGRKIGSPLIPRQVSSAAAQTGKKQAAAETFALCGWNVGFEELKWIAHWQMVNGVTLICQHLEGYTLRGSRKRDYPPSLFYQQPYWEQYRGLNDYFGRIGQLFAQTKEAADICILHPIRSAWTVFSERDSGRTAALDESLEAVSLELSGLHLPYHYVDEGMLARLGRVTQQGLLQVGECRYRAMVLPLLYSIDGRTLELLEEFARAGGMVYSLGQRQPKGWNGLKEPALTELPEEKSSLKEPAPPELPEEKSSQGLPWLLEGRKALDLPKRLKQFVIPGDGSTVLQEMSRRNPCDIRILDGAGREARDIHVMCREGRGGRVYFLANLDRNTDRVLKIMIKDMDTVQRWDLWEYKRHQIEAVREGDRCVFLMKLHGAEAAVLVCQRKREVIVPGRKFRIQSMDWNSITLDCAEYRVDQGEWKPQKAVIRIMKELLEQRREVRVELKFFCDIRFRPGSEAPVWLVMEQPGQYQIEINGERLHFADEGFWKDSAFRRTRVDRYLCRGKNEIRLTTLFRQEQKVYDALFGEGVMETQLNKLTYGTELESIYLCGGFGVYNEADCRETEGNAYVTEGKFYLGELPVELDKGDFSRQGLQFYAGNLELLQEYVVSEKRGKMFVLKLDRKPDCAVMTILVNGRKVRTFAGGGLETDITEFLQEGTNRIVYVFGGTNRNLLGPHHFAGGESYSVGPDTFKETGGWTEPEHLQGKDIWTDTWCFVRFGF